jgi:hypothetical protein
MSANIFLGLRILIGLFLFTFFAWAIWVIWNDLKQKTKESSIFNAPKVVIHPITHPFQMKQFQIPVILIGRDESCNYSIEEPTISARHARLSFHHNQWWIEDLNSSNGTYLNDDPIVNPIVVTSNDQIRCGNFAFEIELIE